MDKVRVESKKHLSGKAVAIMATLIMIVGVLVTLMINRFDKTAVASHDLWRAKVAQQDLALEAKGFGNLQSKQQRFLTAPYSAVVEQILIKPGSLVTRDSVIVKLSNPEIEQAVLQAKMTYNAQKAVVGQLLLKQEREKLADEQLLQELKVDLQVALSRLNAEKGLAKQGVVSALDLLDSQAKVDKLTLRYQHLQNKKAKVTQLHLQAAQIEEQKLNEKASLMALAKSQAQRLNVVAGIDGMLQTLPIEIGQSLAMGSQIALVGSVESLIALVKVPQRELQGLEIGMSAEIDTRGGKADALVKRIDPVVTDGHVEVELDLVGQLPNNARPSLNIAAVINLGVIPQTLTIPIPVNAKPQTRVQVYKVSDNGKSATKTWIALGQRSGQRIQLLSGATQGEELILSAIDQHAEDTIELKL
ncbi:HlyD family secretion protein [Pseudoalteromonas sp. MMG012]|uniref:HlyD family secretion protein n=1 Tax=Pseudoalteromonas sp. MMG012 TaxID=2822686 RepID=UPI001B39F923|nr:HlyD family efflux transporter periplasmic adaptor subunit [Pseudoalteromonas sp. MMG012]MBQ4852433.1 HlyD family efflux transporter periplasmic adaptor subunit [Pseudoalteromonas sp. MMG012]